MAAIRGKRTKPELIVRSIAHRLRFHFRLHAAVLPSKRESVFRSRRAVVFVPGGHMHTFKRGQSTPSTNAAFWRAKHYDPCARPSCVYECQSRNPVQLGRRLARFLETR
jgi:DNA mismatch endonuclease (patch repair protein)